MAHGRAFALFYVNLAYSGFGGRHPDPAMWAVHGAAMQSCLKNKQFFTQGIFPGIDETQHAHTLVRESVINSFKVATETMKVTVRGRD